MSYISHSAKKGFQEYLLVIRIGRIERFSSVDFLTLDTIYILGWVGLCSGRLSCAL